MREIEFRAWDVTNKCWYPGGAIVFPINSMSENAKKIGYELSQYTGLKDKNGTPICEGDIITLSEHEGSVPHEVIYSTSEAMFLLAPKGNRTSEACAWLRGDMFVVGNVYENPELLQN